MVCFTLSGRESRKQVGLDLSLRFTPSRIAGLSWFGLDRGYAALPEVKCAFASSILRAVQRSTPNGIARFTPSGPVSGEKLGESVSAALGVSVVGRFALFVGQSTRYSILSFKQLASN